MICALLIAAIIEHLPMDAAEKTPIDPRVENCQHVRFVNVAGAVPKREFDASVAFAANRLKLNFWGSELKRSITTDLLRDASAMEKTLGEKAAIAVFVEDTDEANPYLAVPGTWCRVNIRHLKSDNPDAQTLRDRTAKAMLRAMAYAGGAGAALDGRGVTSINVHSVKDLDKVAISITPETYMPLTENLRTMGAIGVMMPPSNAAEE